MISLKQKGDFKNLEEFGKRVQNREIYKRLDQFGKLGVELLSSATPKDSGETAEAWSYKIETDKKNSRLAFYNDNRPNDMPIAIMLQYGHATRGGGYVEGIDYINPAIQEVFVKLANDLWREVIK